MSVVYALAKGCERFHDPRGGRERAIADRNAQDEHAAFVLVASAYNEIEGSGVEAAKAASRRRLEVVEDEGQHDPCGLSLGRLGVVHACG